MENMSKLEFMGYLLFLKRDELHEKKFFFSGFSSHF